MEDYTTGGNGSGSGQQYYATTTPDDHSPSTSAGATSNNVYNSNAGGAGNEGGPSSVSGGNTSSNSGQGGITSPNSSQQQQQQQQPQYLVDSGDALLHTGGDSSGGGGGGGAGSPIQAAASSSRDSPGGYGSSSGLQPGHEGGTGSGGEQASSNLSHATRVSPATVAWLMDNYENAEGVSLPRSTLYNHYMRHCNEHLLDAVNAASFGKLIRSVFTGLRTRRLGTRGNSKYHYYGIRVKPSSSLAGVMDDQESQCAQGQQQQQQQQPGTGSSVGKGSLNNGTSSSHGSATSGGGGGGLSHNNNNNTATNNSSGSGRGSKKGHSSSKPPMETFEQCAQFLGDGSGAIPIFPHIDASVALGSGLSTDEITLEDVDTLRSIYREHCEAFLDAVLSLEFATVESLWREFWRLRVDDSALLAEECEEEKYLSKAKLFRLCQLDVVQQFVRQVDFAFYQSLVDVLIPDVLRPIPSTLTQAIRNFAKNLENWLTSSMADCPTAIVQIKLSAVSAFAQTLRRYTSLNHLAQAARAVLQNSSQINQMLADLNRVDFHNVQEQASWVCQCDMAMVERLENDFKVALQQQNSLEQWAAWLRMVVDSALDEHFGKRNFVKAARQFLLKWSFYSSMVIRDLTLRSAASFGSFHLIRLLYDEYMFFIVEHKVAQATQIAPIAVMTECVSVCLFGIAVG